MDRRTFIQELRVPVLATCAICLGSCAKDDITTPGGGNTGGNNTGGNNTGGNTANSFKVDLTKELQAIGSFIFNVKNGFEPRTFTSPLRPFTNRAGGAKL